MASKETALAKVEDFAIMQMDTETMGELLEDNLQGEALNQSDLRRVPVPTAGGTKWIVPNIDGEDEYTDEIVGIILTHGVNRSYWEDPNNPDGSPPICSSPDGKRGFGNPQVEVPLYTYPEGKDGPPAYSCDLCPHAQWDSGRNGGMRCRMTRPLYILRKDDVLPILIQAPPASLTSVKRYMSELLQIGKRFSAVVTHVKLERVDGNPAYSRIKLVKGENLSADQAQFFRAYGNKIAEIFSGSGIRPLQGEVNVTSDDDEHDESEVPF